MSITSDQLNAIWEKYWPTYAKRVGAKAYIAQLDEYADALKRFEPQDVELALRRIFRNDNTKAPTIREVVAETERSQDGRKRLEKDRQQQNLDRLAESEPSQVQCSLPNRGMPPLNASAQAALKAKNYAVYVECMRQAIDQGRYDHDQRQKLHERLEKVEARLLRPVYA